MLICQPVNNLIDDQTQLKIHSLDFSFGPLQKKTILFIQTYISYSGPFVSFCVCCREYTDNGTHLHIKNNDTKSILKKSGLV